MLSIAYVSVADPMISEKDISRLVAQAQRNNERAGLTGALLFNGRNFFQILEGPEAKLEACLQIIRMDPRHSGMVEVRRRPVDRRDFAGWSMLFHHVEGEYVQDLERLAARGTLDREDERMMTNFLALGNRPRA